LGKVKTREAGQLHFGASLTCATKISLEKGKAFAMKIVVSLLEEEGP